MNSRGGNCNPTDDGQPLQAGDAATLSIVLVENGALAAGKLVTFRAEVVELGGGHTHYSERHSLTEYPELLNDVRLGGLPLQGTASAGHFRDGTTRADSIDVVSDSLGAATVEFVAGFLGAVVEVIAIAELADSTVADTASIEIKVPGLVPLEASGGLSSRAYFVGGTSAHAQETNWYVRPEIVNDLQTIATDLSNLMLEFGAVYPQFNDASLPWGGSFNGSASSLLDITGSAATVDDILAAHASHALGVDIDIAFCYSDASGVDDQSSRVSWGSEGCVRSGELLPDLEMERADALRIMRQRGDAQIHDGNHFHIRFWEIS
jgi:hypothetical protein